MKYDVVIIGGGTAGCTAGCALLERGLSVAMVCGGRTIHKVDRSLFDSLGGVSFPGDYVVGGTWRGNRLLCVATRNFGDITIEADCFILAAGKFFSRGLLAGREGIIEPIFNLDVEYDVDRSLWCSDDFFAGQPFESYGVATADDCRAIRGGVVTDNLYAAGEIVARVSAAGAGGLKAVRDSAMKAASAVCGRIQSADRAVRISFDDRDAEICSSGGLCHGEGDAKPLSCGALEDVFEKCLKCGLCNDVCPMLEANILYPGPKRSGPDGERYRLKASVFYDDALSYCLNCKRCEVACPSQVPVGDIIQAARLKYGGRSHVLRNAVLSNTDFTGSAATAVAPLANAVLGFAPAKSMLHHIFGVDSRRQFPSYSSERFVTWYRKNALSKQSLYRRSVHYFHGCYANYNNPQLARDLLKILNAAGYGVKLLEKEKCCGVTLMSNGFATRAKRQGEINIASIRKASGTVVSTSSTCVMMMRDEYPHLLGIDNSDVRDEIMLATRFIFKEIESGAMKLVFRGDYRRDIVYHTSCHISRLGWAPFSTSLLERIPGVRLTVMEPLCCGIAGTFGFKKENYSYSQAVGARLFETLRSLAPQLVACDCETCKWQIEMSTGFRVENPVSILAEALDVEATRAANREWMPEGEGRMPEGEGRVSGE